MAKQPSAEAALFAANKYCKSIYAGLCLALKAATQQERSLSGGGDFRQEPYKQSLPGRS